MIRKYGSKVKTALSLLKTPEKMLLPAGQNGLLKFLPDKIYLKSVFKAETGYSLDLEHPKTYNEKLQWIKINDRNPKYTMLTDKYKVRNYIKDTIGEEYLVPLIGMYKKTDDIPWDSLPDRFVLKCNHASGTNIICKDKAALNTNEVAKQLEVWLKRNAYWGAREWCYKNIDPCIICEEFIETEDGNTPDDYKFMCFNGVPRIIQVHHDRFGDHTLTYYTPEWEKLELKRIDAKESLEIVKKPEKLDEMMSIARILSSEMYFARIDLYCTNGRIYFGEITLYPTGGFSTFTTYEDDLKLGSYLRLPTDM